MLRFFVLALLGVFCCGDFLGKGSLARAENPIARQKFCPVFTDRLVGPDSRFERFRGIRIYFSSDLAARKWMRDPEAYLDTALLPQLTRLTLPKRLIAQKFCPVYPKRKIGIRDPSVLYREKRIYLFDKQAVKIWSSAPEKFLDQEILPQLAEDEKAPEPKDEQSP